MSWWRRLTGGKSDSPPKPQRLDYLNEALALERQGDYDAALTSYRLALRDQPNDPRILQNMAIAFSKTGRGDEAIRCYRRGLGLGQQISGAPHGFGFLLLQPAAGRRGRPVGEARTAHARATPGGRGRRRGLRVRLTSGTRPFHRQSEGGRREDDDRCEPRGRLRPTRAQDPSR